MARAKWFPRLKSTTPLSTAVGVVLASRVRAVRYYLNLLARRPGEDPEHVHQLRVATRRLAAAISVFKSCLGRHARQKLRRAIRRLRRAAGAVRDLDVLRGLWEERLAAIGERSVSAAKPCRVEFERQKSVAEKELAIGVREGAIQFEEALAAATASLKRKGVDSAPEVNLGSVASFVSRKLLRRLRSAGQADLSDLGNLHALRIAAKRLRYAMEVLATCYPSDMRRRLYPRVELLQSEIGKIIDLRNLCRRLLQIRSTTAVRRQNKAAEFIEEIGAAVGRELALRQAEFITRWQAEQRGLERSLKRMVAAVRIGKGRPEHFRIYPGLEAHDRAPSKL